jgi:uncharacterized protein YbbC (DUF1343 family)
MSLCPGRYREAILENKQLVACLLFAALSGVEAAAQPPAVRAGLDVAVADNFAEFAGKRVGIITNPTGVDRQGRHIVDLFAAAPRVKLVALFAPEHGFRGQEEAGAKVPVHVDKTTGTPVYSLYGKSRKPAPATLNELDALIFDIQDVGTRFYTYISTLSLAMEAAAENGVAFYVLDRPNPIGGTIVEGPVLDPAHRSFVGIQPIALRHGMTVGELALMFNEEGWLARGVRCELHVIKMAATVSEDAAHRGGWRRDTLFEDTGLKWVPPSPNMPTPRTALLYPGAGLLEATKFSEGRGTDDPFERVGAPWADSEALIAELRDFLPPLWLRPTDFIPLSKPGKAANPKFKGTACHGMLVEVLEPQTFPSVAFGIHLLCALHRLYPRRLGIDKQAMTRLTGQEWVADMVLAGAAPQAIIARCEKDAARFREARSRYLLYSESSR